MNIEKFIRLVAFAKIHDLDATDIMVLYDVGTAPDGEGTIMKLVNNTGGVSKATRHERIKRLCARGFLIKKEVPKNMRKKTLELSDSAMLFLKQFEEKGA